VDPTFVYILVFVDVFTFKWETLILKHVINIIIVGVVFSSIMVVCVEILREACSRTGVGVTTIWIFSFLVCT
jgi:hypothetical protein